MLEDSRESCVSPICPSVFDEVRAYPLQAANTLITWTLKPNFAEAGPYTFQVQFSEHPVADDTAWEDVAEPAIDAYAVSDETKRQFGQFDRAHYRVKLVTLDGAHVSPPVSVLQHFNFKQRIVYQQVLRTEKLRSRTNPNSASGYLLKRKLTGTRCTVCFNAEYQKCDDPHCLTCYGTGFIGGYWLSEACVWVEFTGAPQQRSRLEGDRGTVEETKRPGRMLNLPQIFSGDVWVQHNTDLRYVVNGFKPEIELAGLPLVLNVDLRQAQLVDVVYQFPINAMVRE